MEVTVAAWAATIAVIVVRLGVDLAVGALRPHAVGSLRAHPTRQEAEPPADRPTGSWP